MYLLFKPKFFKELIPKQQRKNIGNINRSETVAKKNNLVNYQLKLMV